MTLKIFADLMSQPSRALPLFCRAAKIPHELKELRIQKGEFKSPEISKINPLQTVSLKFKINNYNLTLYTAQWAKIRKKV